MANKAICRTCLKKISSDFCKRMGPEEENDETCNILEKLNYCVPELDINLVIDPVICNDCLKLLDIAYKFKTECLKNEEKLLKFSHSTNSRVDINYFCKNVQPTVHKKRLIETQTVKVVEVTSEGNKVGNINDELNANMSKKRPFGCENCYGCQKKINDPSYHAKNYSSPFICYNCGKNIDSIADFRKHMNKHRKQRKCKVCNKCFRDLHTLTTHLRTHTGSRPFSCTLCAKSFREKYKLDQHLKQHRGDDTVKCDICGKVLSTTFNLKIHLEMHKKKTHCELCGETFTTKSELIKHLETDSETCGASIKPKLRKRRAPKKSKKREASPLPVKEEFIKTEPEFYFPSENVFEMSHVEAVPKEEQEDTPDEIDIIN